MHDGASARPRGLAVLAQWLAVNHDNFEFRSLPGCGGGALTEPPLDPARPQYWHRFQIARLYRAYFGRQPDDTGWEYWNRIYSQGRSLAQISGWFAESSEFQTTGSFNDDEFVSFVYGHVLGREPEAEGHDYWVAQLQGPLGRGQLVVYFSESEEYLERTVGDLTGDCHVGSVEESYLCWAAELPPYRW
jgi:hypothetical protein